MEEIKQYKTIAAQKAERIATVTLNRPQAQNAVDEQMAQELRDAFFEIEADDDVWVVVLTGAGGVFCVGTEERETIDEEALERVKAAGAIAGVRKPVIAAINGDAIDQGLELALACDIRVASRSAQLGLTQVKKGRLPWDGGTQRLPRMVGRSWAGYMLLTSTKIGAEDALQVGLVNEVVEKERLPSRGQELAALLARQGPIALRYVKEAVWKGAEVTLEQGLRLEADLYFLLQSTRDRAEGTRSFLERRSPEYRGK